MRGGTAELPPGLDLPLLNTHDAEWDEFVRAGASGTNEAWPVASTISVAKIDYFMYATASQRQQRVRLVSVRWVVSEW